MKAYRSIIILLFITMLTNITGCTGVQSFGIAARPGDTVSLMTGYHSNYSRADFSLKFYDSLDNLITSIPANDPRIRAFVHTYPDPLSKIIIGYETNQDISGPNTETQWGFQTSVATGSDKEWFQSMLIVDLPNTLPLGIATIQVSTTAQPFLALINIDILDSAGSANTFLAKDTGSLSDSQIQSLERANHSTISFTGATIPQAIEINMTHDADVDNGGVGRAYVVNPRGDIKSINWTDDGANLKVVLMPTHNQTLSDMQDFKFYVAGEITGLTLVNAQGFDSDGNTVAITASITP